MKKIILALFALTLAMAATVVNSAPVNVTLVSDNQRSSSGTLSNLSWKGCPGPAYPAPCINPTNSWVVANSVTGSTAVWTWDAATGILASTGTFWSTSYISSSPAGLPVISDKTVDLAINTTAKTTSAANYVCIEGEFLVTVGANGCGNYNLIDFINNSTVAYNVDHGTGPDARCVVRTINPDDESTGNPRGVTNFDGSVDCDPTDGAYVQYLVLFDNTTATGGQLRISEPAPDTHTPPLPVENPPGGPWPTSCYDDATRQPVCSGLTFMTFQVSPTAVDDSANADASGTVQIPVMANDIAYTNPVTVEVSTPPSKGTAVVSGSPGAQAGITIGYTVNSGATGTDTFVYTATDADGITSDSATVTVTITVVDQIPNATAGDIAISTKGVAPGVPPAGGTGVFTAPGPGAGGSLGNTGGSAAVTISVPGSKGTATVAGNVITYTVTDVNFFAGTDTFTYLITDADGETSSADVTVTIPNVLPTLGDASVVTVAGTASTSTPLTTVLGNGNAAQNPRTVTTDAAHGACTLAASTANTTVTYTPTAGYSGPDSCVVTITDGNLDTDTGTLSVTVSSSGGGGGGGGGTTGPQLPPASGALDLWSLSLLGGAAWLRRRRRQGQGHSQGLGQDQSPGQGHGQG